MFTRIHHHMQLLSRLAPALVLWILVVQWSFGAHAAEVLDGEHFHSLNCISCVAEHNLNVTVTLQPAFSFCDGYIALPGIVAGEYCATVITQQSIRAPPVPKY
ncbi:hypothetical protein [Oceanicoccus sp. KOV_DT_Chl]|uniref:hypothetical protein n=1 Tax=Oceanicoccus sp. KOV_DT_Chl TaxID=1904639 RepID=UPI000C7AE224|nr:hypothetical protein [Oceanicoccus sp. KOV_DT_Chl]